MDDNKRPALSGDREKIYQLHRARIAQEENLIHYRTLWMIGSQAILFSLLGGLYDKVENPPSDTTETYKIVLQSLEIILCLSGSMAVVGSLYWINAARQEIEYIKTLYDDIRKEFPYQISRGENFANRSRRAKSASMGVSGSDVPPSIFHRCVDCYACCICDEAVGLDTALSGTGRAPHIAALDEDGRSPPRPRTPRPRLRHERPRTIRRCVSALGRHGGLPTSAGWAPVASCLWAARPMPGRAATTPLPSSRSGCPPCG